jgi:hypothetical protein
MAEGMSEIMRKHDDRGDSEQQFRFHGISQAAIMDILELPARGCK